MATMSTSRFQSAKNLQAPRSLKTSAGPSRNGGGGGGSEPVSPRQSNGNGSYSSNNGSNGYRSPPAATNGFNGGYPGATAMKNGQRRHDVLRSHNSSFGSNVSVASSGSGSNGKEIHTIATFRSTTLAIGSMHEVYVSFVENGPKLFTVQLRATENSLNQMMAALERIPLRNLSHKPTLGMACISRFSEDQVLYRAVIMGINVDSCMVLYVDYGNTENVELRNIFEIPPEFLKHKVFSMRFTLSNVKTLEDTNADIAGIFSTLVLDKVLNMKIMPLEGPAFVQYCELYEQNANIFDKFLDMCKAKPLKYQPALTLEPGHNCLIIIRYIESCKQFYIQPLDKVESFESMMDQLAEFCRKASPMNTLKPGDACVACLEDDSYYRAEVVSVTGNKVKARLVDYGNTITVERNQIKRISPTFVEQQPQVVECCLEGFQDSDDGLSTAQLEMLAENETGDRKQFKLIVSDVLNSVAIVNLLDETHSPVLNVAKRLLKLKNPAKFIKDQQAQQRQQNTPAPKPAPPANQRNPFHSTTVLSEVPNLSQTTPPRMAESEVIDLTADDAQWSAANAQPIGHHSSGYENQTPSNYGSFRSGGQGAGAAARSETSGARSGRDSLNSSFGSAKKERPGQRADIPRFTKDRNQTPYYLEHDDRCVDTSNYESQDSRRGEKSGAQRNRYSGGAGSGSESGFNTQSAEKANSSHDSFKSSTASIDTNEDYVEYEFAFAEQVIPMNTKVEVKLILWISPEEFYVRMKDEESRFEDMMKQIQKFYKGRPAVSEVPPVGSAVVVRYQKHNTFYRGRVIKYNEVLAKFKVELLDNGSKVIVSNPELWKLDRRFTKLPKMAIQCSLASIKLNCDVKELQNKIDKYVSGEPIECVFLDKSDEKYLCDVDVQGADLKMALLKDNLIAQILTDIDLNRLKGQILKLKLMEMKGLDLFRVKILGNDAVLNCRLVEHGTYEQTVVDEILPKWLDQYCFAQVEDVSSDERLILSLLIQPLSTQIPPNIVDMPVLQSKFNAFVTYVHESNCLYVQNARWTPEIGKLLDDLFEYYEKSGEVITNLQMNELCASKSSDGNWYRAKIVSLQEIDNIEVQFVDYGNRECVRHEDLKVLEAQFHEYSAFAHQVFLPMACLNEGEDDKLKLEIAELTGDYELELSVLDYRNGVWIVDITANDYSIVQALKDKQLVKDLDHEEIVNRKSSAVANDPMDVTSCSAESDSKCDTGRLMAYVSHVDNPNQLFIQMNSDLEDIDQLQENLQIIAQQLPPLKDFSVNRYCIAPFSADELWYRARIIDSHDDLIIQFVDYGNSDVITSNKKTTDLKDINDSLMKFKIYAKQCSLLVSPAKMRKNWSENATMLLRDLQEVEVQIVAESQGVNYITLKSGDRDLAEELIAKQLAVKMEYVPSGQRCFTSHIESIREFYLQLERDINPLDVMTDYMARFEEFAVVTSPEEGSIYVAEFPDDGLWYRAKIVCKLSDNQYEVFFLDYGNTSEVSNVRELEKSVAELPPLCTKCTLRLPEGVKSWSDEAESKFKEIAAMGETVFTVQLHTPGSIATVELLREGTNINDHLLDLCEKGVSNVMNASFFLNEEKTLDDSAPLGGFVSISHINSPADFYIQFEKDALKNMEELLLNKATQYDCLQENELCEGMYCLAFLATHDKYYRARIIHIVDGKYKVQLVDYGSIAFATNLRKIPSDMEHISLLAKRCCLETYSPNENVLEVVKDRFIALADQGRARFIFEIVDNDSEPNIIRLLTPEGRNIDDLLECGSGNADDTNNNSSSGKATSVSIAPPPPDPQDLIKTRQVAPPVQTRAKPSRQAFFRAKSDLEFEQ